MQLQLQKRPSIRETALAKKRWGLVRGGTLLSQEYPAPNRTRADSAAIEWIARTFTWALPANRMVT
jgi:hypothetical protein